MSANETNETNFEPLRLYHAACKAAAVVAHDDLFVSFASFADKKTPRPPEPPRLKRFVLFVKFVFGKPFCVFLRFLRDTAHTFCVTSKTLSARPPLFNIIPIRPQKHLSPAPPRHPPKMNHSKETKRPFGNTTHDGYTHFGSFISCFIPFPTCSSNTPFRFPKTPKMLQETFSKKHENAYKKSKISPFQTFFSFLLHFFSYLFGR